jgi:hypothetical protein
MGAHHPILRALPGVDHTDDQVTRREEFAKRHPEVTITSPRQNGTLRFRADWLTVSADPKQDGQPDFEARMELRDLLTYLEAKFDR